MSVVTNVILSTGLVDTGPVEEINEWLRSKGKGELKKVDRYAGGNKSMEVDVYLGAFNHLDTAAFQPLVKALHWAWKEEFLLICQTECDEYEITSFK